MSKNDRASSGHSREENAASRSRRQLLGWIGLGSLAVVAAELIWIAGSFLRPRRARGRRLDVSLFTAGPAERFLPGSVTAFPSGRFYLARLGGGGFLALRRECTHLGCTVPWSDEQQQFSCPCHASAFSITGDVLQSPASRPLDLLPVRIENGIVKVDIHRPLRRTQFRDSQLTYA
jgi:cytochrome b6-f complex iron-sulfur subunit